MKYRFILICVSIIKYFFFHCNSFKKKKECLFCRVEMNTCALNISTNYISFANYIFNQANGLAIWRLTNVEAYLCWFAYFENDAKNIVLFICINCDFDADLGEFISVIRPKRWCWQRCFSFQSQFNAGNCAPRLLRAILYLDRKEIL